MDRLISLRILRAVAALAVVLFHIPGETNVRLGWSVSEFKVGAAGVDLFFVISGFVMMYSSRHLFGERGAWRYFLLRRIIRIVPLYWLVSGLLLLHFLIKGLPETYITPAGVLASFAFYPYARPDGTVGPMVAVGWTLNYEAFFYAVFAAALALRQAAAGAITALFVVSAVIASLFDLPLPWSFWLQPIILEFCAGMWIAVAYMNGRRLSRASSLCLIGAGLTILACSQIVGPDLLGLGGEYWRVLEWGGPTSAIVAGAVLYEARGKVHAGAAALAIIGDASYSLYLTHPLAFGAVRATVSRIYDFSAVPLLYASGLFVASLATALFCYWLVERPITHWLNGRFLKRRLAPALG